MLDFGHPAVVFATPDGVAAVSDARLIEGPDSWRLAGDGLDLTITASADHDEAGDELCRVAGTLTAGGHQRTVECLGTRTTTADVRLPQLEADACGTVAGAVGGRDPRVVDRHPPLRVEHGRGD